MLLELNTSKTCSRARTSEGFWLGGQCPLAAWSEKFLENLTTKWCILKYWNILKNALFACFRFLIFHPFFTGGRSADPICPHVRTPMFASLAGSCVSALANDVPVYFRRYLHGPVFLAHRYPSPAHAIHIRLWQRNPISQRQLGTSGRARYDAIAPFSHQILIYVQTRPIWSFYYFVSSGT